jgi:hypothetical protein
MPTTPYYYIILHSGPIPLLWTHYIHYPLGYLPTYPILSSLGTLHTHMHHYKPSILHATYVLLPLNFQYGCQALNHQALSQSLIILMVFL